MPGFLKFFINFFNKPAAGADENIKGQIRFAA